MRKSSRGPVPRQDPSKLNGGNKLKESDMLEDETKRMEEKLALVKQLMSLEKEKKSTVTASN